MDARQVIFTRVEAAYSPKRDGGYQIVYRSELLSQAEVDEIGRLIQSFASTRGMDTPPRWQYCTLSSGAIMVAKTTVIETDPVIMDKEGRKGIFLTHCIVLDKSSFIEFQNDPFALFDQPGLIVTTNGLRDAIEKFGKGTGKASQFQLHSATSYAADHQWDNEEFDKLIKLAMSARVLKSANRIVLFIGTHEQMIQLLRAILPYITQEHRVECSFSSNMDRVPLPQPGFYWAVGLSSRQTGTAFIEVSLAERRVITPLDSIPFPPNGAQDFDLYQSWFETARAQGVDLQNWAPIAQKLSSAYRQRRELSDTEVHELGRFEDACRNFYDVHHTLMMTRMREAFTKFFRNQTRITDALVKYCDQYATTSSIISVAISGKITDYMLVRVITSMIEQLPMDYQTFTNGEWRALLEIMRPIKPTSFVGIFWVSAFCGKVADAVRVFALDHMVPKEFERALKKLYEPFEPVLFVGPKPASLTILFHNERLTQMPDEQLLAMLEAVFTVKAERYLNFLPDVLLNRLLQFDEAQLKRIETLTDASIETSTEFLNIVQQRRATFPVRQGIIKSLFGNRNTAQEVDTTSEFDSFGEVEGENTEIVDARFKNAPAKNPEYQQDAKRRVSNRDRTTGLSFTFRRRDAHAEDSDAKLKRSNKRADDEQSFPRRSDKPNNESDLD